MKKHFALIMACLMLTPAFAACTYDDSVDPVITKIARMAVCDPACALNQVCDDGVCRDVVPCPSDSNKKCFNALDLTPTDVWGVDKISPDTKDYAGSSYDFYLPIHGVVTCNYPTAFNQSYCQETGDPECSVRNETIGCYMINADEQLGFTLMKKSNSYWTDHNFDAVFTISSAPIASDSKFSVYAAPAYEVKPTDVLRRGILSFKNINQSKLVVHYEPNECIKQSPKNFQLDQLLSPGTSNVDDIACTKAYQLIVQIKPTGDDTMVCDKVLTYCATDGSIEKCGSAPYCHPDDCKKSIEPNDDIKNKKLAMFEAINNNNEYQNPNLISDTDKEKYYGYADPRYGWHNCREGNVLLNNFAVYVEVSDDEITK